MAERFYVNCELNPGLVLVQGAEAHHLAVVCRLRPGDAVCLFNGDGRQYPARITEVGRHGVTLEVLAVETPGLELPFRVEVAAPLPKGDRAQFLIEKLTELGVASFVPLRTARSVVHPRDTKRDKLQRHAIEASKQCGRNVLLQVRPIRDWSEYCRETDLPARRILGHRGGERDIQHAAGDDTVVAVGPEGGFTEEEIASASAAGWRLVDLGPRILRIETAAMVLAIRFSTYGPVAPGQETSERR